MSVTIIGNERLLTVLAGAALIITGVHLNNGSKQAGREPPKLGQAAFVGGWGIVAYGLGFDMWSAGGAAAVVAAVMVKEQGGPQMKQFVAPLFIGGWLAVAYAAGGRSTDLTNISVQLALGAAFAVFLSMLKILPQERMSKITDTIGMPIFTAAWFALAAARARV